MQSIEENGASIISNKDSSIQILKDFTSNLIGSLSGGMFSFAMGLMMLNQTHLAISFGLSTIIGPLVSLSLLVPMGDIVDRYPHRHVLIVSSLFRLLGLGLFAWTQPMFSGISKLIPVIMFTIIDYICSDFSSTAYSSSVHELVNNRYIQKLSSLTSTASSISSIFSPMLGLALYSLVGFEVFIFVEIISSFVSFGILLTMRFHNTAEKKTILRADCHGQMAMFKEGIRYVKNRPLIKGAIIVGTVLNFSFTSVTVGMPFIVTDTLHLGTAPIGFLETGSAIGILFGSLYMGALSSSKHAKYKMLLPVLADCVLLMVLGWIFKNASSAHELTVLGTGIMIVLGLLIVIPDIVMQVEIQRTVPTVLLGRVNTTLMTINNSVTPLATVFYTFLFQNIQRNYLVFILSGLIALIYMVSILPRMMFYFKQEGIS